jgi:hypothetical protein
MRRKEERIQRLLLCLDHRNYPKNFHAATPIGNIAPIETKATRQV